jgi:hypothetical protein
MRAEDNTDDFLTEIKEYMEEERRKERPDYRNTVYCDKHLGVKMRLASSWTSIEYSDTSVDANTNLLWLCPKRIVIATMNPPCSATTLMSQDDD